MQIRSCRAVDIVWKVQLVTLWVLGVVTVFSSLPKTEPLWFLMCSLSLCLAVVERVFHEKLRHENALRAIDVEFWVKQRTNWEQAKKDVDASFERNKEFLKTIQDAIADQESYRRDWQRELNRHARQTGQPVPFPSVDAVDRSETKN